MHQLTDNLFRSKIPLEFEAERLEEHPKPTGVEVEGLETLAGSHEVEKLAYKEITDSHSAPQHMNHVESKAIARRIKIEEPSRLVIRRKLPEEVLRIEMLKHVARVDDLTLETFHGSAVPAIYILFESPSRESTRALGIRTCRGSPAMLTKRSHMTAQRVVAARTQVILHTDETSVTGQLCKIAAIEEYEEWVQINGWARSDAPLDGNGVRRAQMESPMARRRKLVHATETGQCPSDHGTRNDEDGCTERGPTLMQERTCHSMEMGHDERGY
ncbi:hypothetical protein M404DRAFT_20920 [Pisolithus tinctorius Marx 270]|uniref:Uncharacterized protein n=1 Tax=Pisolithus tinctorius Marx 270 TaxID=870435 RepID=A0A0C3JN90_PISTI|nr:hypothetical protein M404DRAFT_20920 [Pisolithus tinctorius Marx 270]